MGSKMSVTKAIKMMREYDHVIPVDEYPIPQVYQDKDGYRYNYTLYLLAIL